MKTNFENQYISIMGDSISTFAGIIPEDYPEYYSRQRGYENGVYTYKDTWWGIVLERLGAKLLINNSWSGSFVTRPRGCEIESYGASDARCSLLDDGESLPSHIIIYMGTNDRGWHFPLRGLDKSDISVFENAYSLMLEKIRKNYPNATVWCMTLPRTYCSGDPIREFPNPPKDDTLAEFSAVIAECANSHGCRVISLFDEKLLVDTVDKLHPNYNGMLTIAERVIEALIK